MITVTEQKRLDFISMYKAICEEYGMYICPNCNECGTEIGVEIEEAMSPEELADHFIEIVGPEQKTS